MVKHAHLGALVIVGLVAAVWLAAPQVDRLKASLVSTPFQLSLARKEIDASIKIHGAQKTYDRIKEILQEKDSIRQHTVAHIFGELLYRENGLSGITVCDSSFGFGCYHSFFGKAVSEGGEGIVPELDRLCVASFGVMGLGCAHGIGHGLGEYFGPSRVDEQLRLCEGLSWKGKYMGCQSGVFMEYNTPVSTDGETAMSKPRPWDERAPYGSCLSVAEKFRPSCFLEIAGWWEQVIPRQYPKMGDLCARLRSVSDRESCFLGIGYNVVQSHEYDTASVKEICATFPSDGELLCRAGASWSFFANPDYRQAASEFCRMDTQEKTALCQKKSDLLGNGSL